MSFVSVLANSNYLSLVADGRVTMDGVSVGENFKKFKKISEKQFIAFAGSKEPCESVVDQVKYLDRGIYDLKQVAIEIHSAIYNNERLDGFNLLFIVGGLNQENEIEFHNVSRTEKEIESYYPDSNDDFQYAYAHNSKIELEIDNKLLELRSRIGTNSTNRVVKIQRELNDYVAQHDKSVNRITNELRIRKR